MNLIELLFGRDGGDLNSLQMSCRAVIVFFIALILIRISGRRSFKLHTAPDNIVTILLGAVLSRAVTGASPFVPVISSCLVIVLIHRGVASLHIHNKFIQRFLTGRKIIVYQNGDFIRANMDKALVCKEDVMLSIRKMKLSENLDDIDIIYIERNGDVTAIMKKPAK